MVILIEIEFIMKKEHILKPNIVSLYSGNNIENRS